jgi:signal peptidase I
MKLRPLKIYGLIVGAMVVLGIWTFLAPTKLGGSSTYSITSGVSMQPLLYKNDLAIVRAQPSYHVGDVVLYQSQVLHRPVLHRIILIQNGNYFFKGDNNSFVDPGYATRSELTGKLWVHIPQAGAVLSWFGKPAHAAVLSGLVTIMLVLTGISTADHKKHNRYGMWAHKRLLNKNSSPEKLAMSQMIEPIAKTESILVPPKVDTPKVLSYFDGSMSTLITLGILLTLAFTFLVVGFGHPSKHVVPLPDAYQQTGSFSYSAAVKAPTIVYPSGVITTGQPIYPSLVDNLNLYFGYHFNSSLMHSIRGTVEMRETIRSESSSWQQISTLKSNTPFNGSRTSISSSLPLNSLYSLISNVSTQSGTTGANYSVNIQAIVHITGTVGGKPVNQTFSPILPFTIGQTSASITQTSSPVPAGATYVAPSASSQLASTLHPVQAGTIPEPINNTISIAKYKVSVSLIRLLGLIFSSLALLIALIHDTLRRRQRVNTEDQNIEAQFGSLIVPVSSLGIAEGMILIEVPKFIELARLAQYLERPILCETNNGNKTYVVDDEIDRYITYSSEIPEPLPEVIKVANTTVLPKQKFVISYFNSRKLSSIIIRVAAGLLALIILGTLLISFTASNNVPASKVGITVTIPQLSEFAPTGCNSLTITSFVTGSGTFTNNLSHVIIVGSAGVDNITDHGTGNCIIGGGGKDKVIAPSTDICIIGPTSGATYGSCTTKSQ